MEEKEKGKNYFSRVNRFINNTSGLGALLPLAVIIVLLWVTTDNFMSFENIMQVLRQAAVYALMGIGMTFVIITDHITDDITDRSANRDDICNYNRRNRFVTGIKSGTLLCLYGAHN